MEKAEAVIFSDATGFSGLRWTEGRRCVAQLAANMMPPGSLVIANIPLAPAVYRTLRSQAAGGGQTPAQLMAAILSRAAGK